MTGFIPAPIKPEIAMDHLEKVDIRTGLIERVGRGLVSRNYLGARDVTRSVLPWHATLDSSHASPPRHCQARAVSNPLPRARLDFLRNPLAAGVGKERNHV
jgi:hypothetical protein